MRDSSVTRDGSLLRDDPEFTASWDRRVKMHEPDTLAVTVDGRERIYCPGGCGNALEGVRCKLVCPVCGPVVSCSDL